MSRHHHPSPPPTPAPATDPLVKMHEDLMIQYNNLALEMEQRISSGDPLSESYGDFDWANRVDKDYLWIRTSGANSPQFRYMTKEIIDMYADIANFMAVYSPLIRRIVEVKTQFTFAMNVGITSDTIQGEIDAILKDDINKMALFDAQAVGDADSASQKEGNIFFAIWKDKKQVRAWSSYEIRDIVLDPEDSARPLFYLRTWLGTDGKERKEAYPSLYIRPEEMRDNKTALSYLGSSYTVNQEVRVYHMSSRKGIRQKFALSELVAACRWAKPHEKFIEDFHAIASAYRKYSHMMTTKGSAAQASAIAGQFQGNTSQIGTPLQSNPVGSMIVAQEGNELKTISAGSGNIIGIEGARASLMMVCAASGVPETYLTMDPSTGNLATAKEISPVFIMMIEARQTIWKNALTAVFKYMLESDKFDVSFPPIRDNLNQYILNMNAIAKKPDGSWSGAVRGADYVKAAHEALEWKLPPKEEVEAMGAALEEIPEPDTTATDQGLTDIALAAQGLTQAAAQRQGTPPGEENPPKQPVPPGLQAYQDKNAAPESRGIQEADDDVQWITVGGQHIPIKPGQSKGDAVNQAIGGKRSSGSTNDGSSGNSSKGTAITNDHKEYDKKLVKAMAMGSNKELGGKIAAEQEKGMTDHFAYGQKFENDSTVNDYTRLGYAKLNNDLRQGKTDAPAVAHLDKIISNSPTLPEGTVLYRGVGERGVASMMNMKPGDACNDKAFQSFSTNPNNSMQFTTRANIPGEKGTHKVLLRAVTSGKEHGFVVGGEEHEIIMPRGTGWKVVSNNAITSGVNAGRVTTHVITVVPA